MQTSFFKGTELSLPGGAGLQHSGEGTAVWSPDRSRDWEAWGGKQMSRRDQVPARRLLSAGEISQGGQGPRCPTVGGAESCFREGGPVA